jgi:catechol 2,3-dioxygenase-like lactoylglutathione lyase family enzyme
MDAAALECQDYEFGAMGLIPELSVRDCKASLEFYVKVLGFEILYQRPEEGFAMLILGEAKLMIDQIGLSRDWETAPLEYPLGRGINFQITVTSVEPLLENLAKHNIKLFLNIEERWYRKNDLEVGNRQFLVQDPDGYLLRFTEDLGTRPLGGNHD